MIYFLSMRDQAPPKRAAKCCAVCRREIIRRYKAAKKDKI